MSRTTTKRRASVARPSKPVTGRSSEDVRFRQLFEGLPDAALVHSQNKIVLVNSACMKLLGAERTEQLLGKNIFDFIHPDYASIVKERIAACQQNGEALPPLQQVVVALDGSSTEVEVVAIPLSWNGALAIEVVLRDIDERRQTHSVIRDWKERMMLAERSGLPIGLWDLNLAENTVQWSPETYRQFGFTRKTFSGRVEDAMARIHPEDRARVQQAIAHVAAGEFRYSAQYRVLLPDGSVRWIDAHGVPVRNGSPRILGISIDITHLKETEQSLHESEEKYLSLLNSTAEGIYGLDLQGNCTFCNPACVRLLGYNHPRDLLGKNMHAVVRPARSDGTRYTEEQCPICATRWSGQAGQVTGEWLQRADGSRFVTECWSHPVMKDGKAVGAVVTFIDISQRHRAQQALRQSEHQYRELFEYTTYGVYRAKRDGTLLDVNPALVNMLGYSSKEELLTRNLEADIFENPQVRRDILAECPPGGRVNGTETRWRRKDGKIITVRLSGRETRTEDGQISHYEVIVDDITEQRSLEEQLRQAQKMEAIGRLAGGVAHDFNNALGVITGYSELLQMKLEADDPRRRYAEEIFKAGQKAASLTQQLLAFSRKQPMHPVALDLKSVVADTEKMLRRLIGEDIELILAHDPQLGTVRADRSQVEQTLMNLAVNARDAMPKGGRLTIELSNVEFELRHSSQPYVKPGRYVMLSVSDSGSGIDPSIQAHIFEPFFTTKEPGKGTGLGLSMIYGVVQQNSGYILVDSEPAKGTRFRIFLPRIDEEATPEEASMAPSLPMGSETILVVEDEPALRDLTRACLQAKGYNVLMAENSRSALELAREYQGHIHLLLTDVILPDLSGPELARTLFETRSGTRLLYMSGYTDDLISERGVLNADTLLLEKPFTIEALLKKVREALQHERARATAAR
jgi:PAS domain S-box-containing protein